MTRKNIASPLLFVLAATLQPISCTRGAPSHVVTTVETVEEATESFANAMLDLGVALRNGSLVEVETGVAPFLEAIPFPRRAGPDAGLRTWVRRHNWQMNEKPTEISRAHFVEELQAFLDHYSELEDVRFKVKKSTVHEDSIDSEVALAIVGRNLESLRTWTRGRASVHAKRHARDSGWMVDRFIITSLDTLVADRDLFSEIAVPVGIDCIDPPFLAREGPSFAAYGAAVADVDGNSFVDLVVTSEHGVSLYLNRGDGTFDDVAAEASIRDVHGDAIAPLLLDVDNDGDLDLFLSAIGTQMLFENRLVPDDRLEFWDVSAEAGVARPGIGFSAVAGDVDRNGYPDIYVASYNRYGQVLPDHWDGATNGTPNLLFLNRGDGTFDEVGADWGVADARWSYAAAFADIDGDSDLDLYVTNDFGGGNSLFVNEGGKFVDRADEFGVSDGGYGMGVSFGDYDNDGDLDLHVTRMSSTAGRRILARLGSADLPSRERLEDMALGNSLYEHTDDGFHNVSDGSGPFPAGWAWGGGFVDMDNDGLEDLYTPNGFISGTRLHDT